MPRTKPTFAATIDVGFVHNTTCHRVRLMGRDSRDAVHNNGVLSFYFP